MLRTFFTILVIAECLFQLGKCFFGLFGVSRSAMPFVAVVHKVNTKAHFGMHQYHYRFALPCVFLCFFKGGSYLF